MPVEIDALQEWKVGDRMLDDMLRGMKPDDARQAEWRRGTLPPGKLGWRKATEICDQADALAAAAAAPHAGTAGVRRRHRRRRRAGGSPGTVPRVYGDRLVAVTYSKLDGRHLLESWIRLVALTAQYPGREWTAVCIGRPKRRHHPQGAAARPAAESAVDLLRDLVAMYDAGRREPIPLPLKTSYAWAETEHHRGDPEREAGCRWKTGKYPGEDAEPAHVRVWGQGFLARGPGRRADCTDYAARLWLPMLRPRGSD